MTQTTVDETKSIKDRVDFLKYCANKYETNGTSPISDAEYDKEYYILKALVPNNDFFNTVGGIDIDNTYGTAIKHLIKMGSLNKSLNIESFGEWLKNEYNSTGDLVFLLQHKIDGLSLSLLYKNGKLVQALTRGDGEIGFSAFDNVKYIKTIPQTIINKEEVEIRGEVFVPLDIFHSKWASTYKHPRNFAAGSLNQKDATITGERDLSFIGYEVVRKEFKTEAQKLNFLEEMGFKTLKETTKFIKCGSDYDTIIKAVKFYMDNINRKTLPYLIDGVVFKLNDVKLFNTKGYNQNGLKPKANRAIKFPPTEAITKLKDIDLNVCRTGVIVPVGILEPVELDGATIGRVTLHNFGKLKEYKKDSIVTIAKKGDIIPQIIKINKMGDNAFEIPKYCPECNTELKWDGPNLICPNPLCVAQLNSTIEHWLKKINVKGIGKGIISMLTDIDKLSWENKPIISSLAEIYYMLDNDTISKNPQEKYNYLKEMLGEKRYSNIIKSIHSVKEISLNKFIEALGIGKVGTMAKDIVDIAPTIKDIDNLTIEDLIKLDKFAEIKAKSFIKGWKTLRKQIEILLKYIDIKEQEIKGNSLKGLKFCFTGSFSSPSRKEMAEMVSLYGGKASSSVGKDTILVWDEEERKNKYNKAVKNGNKIINQKDFLNLLK